MTSPRTSPAERPDEAADEPKKTTLSPVQITAGALASVSSAVVASFFGVAGTLIGAALASVISTVTAALYTNSLSRTNERLRKVRVQLAAPGSPGQPAGDATTELTQPPAEAAAETRVLPAALDPRRAPAPRRGPRWPRVAVYAVAVFGLAMVIVTGIEIVSQQPVSALVGAEEASSTTTLGEITGDSSTDDEDPGTPAPTPAPSTTSETPATGTPGDDTGTSTPSTSGTTTETPSEAPEETGTSTAEPTDPSDGTPQDEGSTDQEPDGGTSPEAAGADSAEDAAQGSADTP